MVAIDDDVRKIIRSPDFGGASITFPHKIAIRNELNSISEAALLIGAVNTIVVETDEKRSLRGENTDWLAIMNVIKEANLGLKQDSKATVIGAGGAARAAVFALQNVGIMNVSIVNRTLATAKVMAQTFPDMSITIYTELSEAPPASIIIGCIPADDMIEADIPRRIFGEGPGVLIEMSYRPPISALMKVAQRQLGWKVADGVDVLKRQAYAQFEMWTKKAAPIISIEQALAMRRI